MLPPLRLCAIHIVPASAVVITGFKLQFSSRRYPKLHCSAGRAALILYCSCFDPRRCHRQVGSAAKAAGSGYIPRQADRARIRQTTRCIRRVCVFCICCVCGVNGGICLCRRPGSVGRIGLGCRVRPKALPLAFQLGTALHKYRCLWPKTLCPLREKRQSC